MLENPIVFGSPHESHQHALETLSLLEQYQDFMMSIDSMCDVGCGDGLDLEWWATRTVEDDNGNAQPLNIKCTGIDLKESLTSTKVYKNISYERRDFESAPEVSNKYDVIWCHNSFQYALNPLSTLMFFNRMLTKGGMLALTVPQTTNVVYHKQEFDQIDGQYYNYSIVSLIHMLAVNGFDCKGGFFKKNPEDPWIHAIVYKSRHAPMDPRTTRWIDLMEKDLLPDSADISINKCGYVRQRELVLPWINKSNASFR